MGNGVQMKIGEAKNVVGSSCINCGKFNDAATAVGNDAKPKPCDVALCYYCGHIMAYGDDLKLRELTGAEMIQIAGDPRVVAASAAIIYSRELEKKTP